MAGLAVNRVRIRNGAFRKPVLNTPSNKMDRSRGRLALAIFDSVFAQGQNSKKCLPRERVVPLASPSQRRLPAAPVSKARSPAPVSLALTVLCHPSHPKAQGQSSKKDLPKGHCALLPSSGQRCLPAPSSKARSPKTPVGLELMLLDNQGGQGPNSKKVLVVGDAMLRLRPGERRLLASPVPLAIVPAGTNPAQGTIQNPKLTKLASSVPSVEEVDQTDVTVAEPKKSLWQTVTQPKVLKVAGIILGVAAMVALGGAAAVAVNYYFPSAIAAHTPAVAQAGRFVALNTHQLLIAPGFKNMLFFATMAMHTAIIPAAKVALPVVLPVISTMIISTLAAYLVLCVANKVWGAVKGLVWGAMAAVAHAFGRELDKTYVGMAAKGAVTTVAGPIIEAFEMKDFDDEDKGEEVVLQSPSINGSDDKDKVVPPQSSSINGSDDEDKQASLASRVASYASWAVFIACGAKL